MTQGILQTTKNACPSREPFVSSDLCIDATVFARALSAFLAFVDEHAARSHQRCCNGLWPGLWHERQPLFARRLCRAWDALEHALGLAIQQDSDAPHGLWPEGEG